MLNIDYGKVADELITNYVGNTRISEETILTKYELQNKNKYNQVEQFLKFYKERFDLIDMFGKEELEWDKRQTNYLANLIENLMK